MEQRPITKLKVPLRAITLSRDSLRKLLEIVSKAKEDDPDADVKFEFEGKDETVAAESIDPIVNSRLPKDLKGLVLEAYSGENRKKISFRVRGIGDTETTSTIEVEAQDIDWVNARMRELENFMSDHGNFHWIFQKAGLILIQAVALGTVIALSLRAYDWGSVVGMFSGFLYLLTIRRLFPVIVLDTERQSSIKTIRKVFVGIITGVFIALIVNLVVRLILNI